MMTFALRLQDPSKKGQQMKLIDGNNKQVTYTRICRSPHTVSAHSKWLIESVDLLKLLSGTNSRAYGSLPYHNQFLFGQVAHTTTSRCNVGSGADDGGCDSVVVVVVVVVVVMVVMVGSGGGGDDGDVSDGGCGDGGGDGGGGGGGNR
uniref:Uncharacterized protein n=1 Tax=Glossina pallidipes TaxID=7398 RepID=A0A1A9ZIJ5_GLOPL